MRVSKVFVLTFLNIVALDENPLFAVLVPPPEGGGKLVFADGSHHPLPTRSWGSPGSGEGQPAALSLFWTRRSPLAPNQVSKRGGEVAGSPWRPASFWQLQQCERVHCPIGKTSFPLLSLASSSSGEPWTCPGPPGCSWYWGLSRSERCGCRQSFCYQRRPATSVLSGWHGLWPWWGLVFLFRSTASTAFWFGEYGRTPSSRPSWWSGPTLPWSCGRRPRRTCCRSALSPPFALSWAFWHPARRLLYQAKFHMQDVVHSSKGYPLSSGKFSPRNTPVSFGIGGHGANDVKGLLRFLRIQMPLIFGAFPGLNFVDDLVNWAFWQWLAPKSWISHVFVSV